MAKVISLFNHKGGVSKTTTTFHLGWMLAKLGKKVLIVDADPQCNLTGLTLGIEDYDSLFDFYDKKSNNDIYSSLAGVFGFSNTGTNLDNGVEVTATKNPNLSILAGHIDFAKFDLQIATALTSVGSIPMLRTLIGAMNKLIQNTAKKGNFDIVLIDMSPSISATNMCLFVASDYFIIPTSPDFYCYQAIDSLSNFLPDWSSRLDKFKDDITLPKNNPKMLGVISSNYRVYGNKDDDKKEMTKEFKIWAEKIREITHSKLVKELEKKDMVISRDFFSKNVSHDTPYNLANIQDFNSLIPVSQKLSKPIFDLTKEDGNWGGALWNRIQGGKKVGAKYQIENSKKIYSELATAILKMIGN